MNLQDYQLQVNERAITRPDEDFQLATDALSLCGAAHHINRVHGLRDNGALLDYLGDALFYTTRVLSSFELKLIDYAPPRSPVYPPSPSSGYDDKPEGAVELLEAAVGLCGQIADHLSLYHEMEPDEFKGSITLTLLAIASLAAYGCGYTLEQLAHRNMAALGRG